MSEWKGLEGFRVEHLSTLEEAFDTVMAFINLHVYFRKRGKETISVNGHQGGGSFVISLEPDSPWKEVKPKAPQQPQNIEFLQFLRDGPRIKDVLAQGKDRKFKPTAAERGRSLFESGFVQLIQVQKLEAGWMVMGHVAASFQADTYVCALLMDKENPMVDYVGSCTNG